MIFYVVSWFKVCFLTELFEIPVLVVCRVLGHVLSCISVDFSVPHCIPVYLWLLPFPSRCSGNVPSLRCFCCKFFWLQASVNVMQISADLDPQLLGQIRQSSSSGWWLSTLSYRATLVLRMPTQSSILTSMLSTQHFSARTSAMQNRQSLQLSSS